MRFLTSIGFSRTSKPATVAVPSVGGKKHVRMRIVVVFPAPFGPRKPTICPFWTWNEMLLTAMLRAYLLVRPVTVIIDVYSRRRRCKTEEDAEVHRTKFMAHPSADANHMLCKPA